MSNERKFTNGINIVPVDALPLNVSEGTIANSTGNGAYSEGLHQFLSGSWIPVGTPTTSTTLPIIQNTTFDTDIATWTGGSWNATSQSLTLTDGGETQNPNNSELFTPDQWSTTSLNMPADAKVGDTLTITMDMNFTGSPNFDPDSSISGVQVYVLTQSSIPVATDSSLDNLILAGIFFNPTTTITHSVLISSLTDDLYIGYSLGDGGTATVDIDNITVSISTPTVDYATISGTNQATYGAGVSNVVFNDTTIKRGLTSTTGAITIRRDGLYKVSGQVGISVASNTAGSLSLYINVGFTTVTSSHLELNTTSGGAYTIAANTNLVQLSAGDLVTVDIVNFTSDNNLTSLFDSSSTYLNIEEIL